MKDLRVWIDARSKVRTERSHLLDRSDLVLQQQGQPAVACQEAALCNTPPELQGEARQRAATQGQEEDTTCTKGQGIPKACPGFKTAASEQQLKIISSH
jgi:hypothetical protein